MPLMVACMPPVNRLNVEIAVVSSADNVWRCKRRVIAYDQETSLKSASKSHKMSRLLRIHLKSSELLGRQSRPSLARAVAQVK